MALYLGSEKLELAIAEYSNSSSLCLTGTAISDSNGVVTFPQLDFTPKLIAVWNITKRDLKAEAEANGEDWDDSYTQYIYNGSMVFAVYQDGVWVSQGLTGMSGEVFISNATFDSGSGISVNNNTYSYRIMRNTQDGEVVANELFNYAIYG